MTRLEIQSRAAERYAKLLEWRGQGKTDRQIAQLLGVTEARAWQLRQKAAKWRKHVSRGPQALAQEQTQD